MAGVEARHLALQPARSARRESETLRGEEPRQPVATEGDGLALREGLRVEPRLVQRQPQAEARQQATRGDGRLGEEVVEAASAGQRGAHGEGVARRGPEVAPRRLAFRLAAAAAALGLAGCALLGPRPLPDALLASLEGRAERARGLRFPAPVDALFVRPGRLAGILAGEIDGAYGPDEFHRAEQLESALGLLPPGVSLRRALLELQTGTIAGFYTPLRRRLYVVYDGPRGGPLPPETAAVAVHELVHALQAAHTPLLDVLLGLDDHDDLAFAIGSLLEGDALWAAYRDQRWSGGGEPPSAADFAAELRSEDFEAVAADAPRLLRESFLLQYPLGYTIAADRAARGGTAALDAALRNPPLSSEELLHPAAYLEGAPRQPLPWLRIEPEAVGLPSCRARASNAFGELGLRVFGEERGASPERAQQAAEGWDGDRAMLLECGGGTAFAWLLQFDGVPDADEFAALAAAAPLPGLELERAGRRVLLVRGLDEPARRTLLAAPEERFADLAAYLAARPLVLERAARLRARAR
jgi:hypothetical protein